MPLQAKIDWTAPPKPAAARSGDDDGHLPIRQIGVLEALNFRSALDRFHAGLPQLTRRQERNRLKRLQRRG